MWYWDIIKLFKLSISFCKCVSHHCFGAVTLYETAEFHSFQVACRDKQ